MRRSFLFSLFLGFCGGVILAEFIVLTAVMLIGGGVVGAAVSSLVEGRPRLIGLVMIGLVIGLVRTQAWLAPTPTDLGSLLGQRVMLVGTIVNPPGQVDDQQAILLTNVESGGQRRPGKVSIRLGVYPKYQVGQKLTVRCILQSFSQPSRLRQRLHGVRGYCRSPEVDQVEAGAHSWRIQLGQIEARVLASIAQNFSDPSGAFLAGIILGAQTAMPNELRQDFVATGTTHIVALSGFNVTIIVSVVTAWLVRLIGRRWAWLPSLLLVIAFVVMTGASASVTRAAIMAVVSQLALFFGRPISMTRLLSYTALLMVWGNPLVLLHDLGFQLSFLATIGLVFVAKPLAEVLPWIPETFSLRENLATTLGAMVMTEPLLIWQFGRLSLIAPVVNILVLPMIPLAMAVGFITISLCLISPALGLVVVPVADALLRLVLFIISTGAHLPNALTPLAGPVAAIAAAGCLGLATFFIIRNYAHPTLAADR